MSVAFGGAISVRITDSDGNETFSAELNGKGHGPVRVNGQPVATRGFTLVSDIASVPKVSIEYMPTIATDRMKPINLDPLGTLGAAKK